jgi:hypothetical protein
VCGSLYTVEGLRNPAQLVLRHSQQRTPCCATPRGRRRAPASTKRTRRPAGSLKPQACALHPPPHPDPQPNPKCMQPTARLLAGPPTPAGCVTLRGASRPPGPPPGLRDVPIGAEARKPSRPALALRISPRVAATGRRSLLGQPVQEPFLPLC